MEKEINQASKEKAHFLLKHRRGKEAAKEAARMIASNPEDPEGYFLMGFSLLQQGKYEEALDHAKKARGMDPEEDRYVRLIGLVYYYEGKTKPALKHFTEAHKLDPEYAQYMIDIADCHQQNADFKKVVEWCNKALAIDPSSSEAINTKGESLSFLGKKKEATKCFESVLSLEPENVRAQTNLGWRRLKSGDREEAKHLFTSALSSDPSYDEAKEGVKEILRQNYSVYRWLRQFSEWRNRLGFWQRVLFYLPVYLLFRVGILLMSFNKGLFIGFSVIFILYIIFLFLLTLIKPITNLVLSLNRFGRLAVDKNEKIEGWWIVATLFGILLSIVGLTLMPHVIWTIVILTLIMSIFIIKRIFWTNRVVMRGVYTIIYIGGVIGGCFGFQKGVPSVAGGIFFITFLWVLISGAVIRAVEAGSR